MLRTRFGPNAKWELFESEWREWYVTNVVKFANPIKRLKQVPTNSRASVHLGQFG